MELEVEEYAGYEETSWTEQVQQSTSTPCGGSVNLMRPMCTCARPSRLLGGKCNCADKELMPVVS